MKKEGEILAASILKKHFAGSGHLYKKEKDHESNRVREVCGTQL